MLLTGFRVENCRLDLAAWQVEVVGDQDKWRDPCSLETRAFHPKAQEGRQSSQAQLLWTREHSQTVICVVRKSPRAL